MFHLDPMVQAAIVTGIFGLLAIFAESLRRQVRDVRIHAEATREQVTNSHQTNLRDDVDRVLDGLDRVLAGQERHDGAIAGLRDDLALERKERLAVANRLDDHLASN